MDKYNELRNKYDTFIYEGFDITNKNNKTLITFNFNVLNLTTFKPTIELDKEIEINSYTKYLIFHIGLIELISYWKATCSKNVIIKAAYLNNEQIAFFKKLYFYGLGELFYTNGIKASYEDFMTIKVEAKKEDIEIPKYQGVGNLIPIGGGKDSNVTLELLKNEKDNKCFIINPKDVNLECCHIAGYNADDITIVKRTIDKNLLDLNNKGFINGHTPFSSLVAFTSFLCAYLENKKYIVLSNEASANEGNVKEDTMINHQYSKTYTFENDFNNYIKNYFKIDIKYFSLLRPLSEYQIAMLFSKYEKYHKVFKSCNVGSKKTPWEWCGTCPKCLFVFIILSPFLYKEKLISIFKKDLFEDPSLLDTLKELAGKKDVKPFECVGTFLEVRYALTKTIKQTNDLPYLLKYYKDNYPLEDLSKDKEHEFNLENNLDPKFINIIKEAIDNV